jgi:membrane protease YdiL (CAAX protease family)
MPGSYSRLFLIALLAPGIYLLFCALLSAVLGYPLLLLLQGAVPLHVLMGRISQVFLFLGVWPLARGLGLGWADFGFSGKARRVLGQIGIGFALGVAMLGVHALVLVALDIRLVNPERLGSVGQVLGYARTALLTGLGVALVEEPMFRGFLLGSLNRVAPGIAAVVVCSLYFAGLHFLKPALRPEFADVHWHTGFPVALDAFVRLPERIQLDSFLALFCAGMLLGIVRLMRPGNLGYCIGIHAGWVFVIKFTRALTTGNPEEILGVLVSRFDGVIGYLATAWMALLVLALWAWSRRLAKQAP